MGVGGGENRKPSDVSMQGPEYLPSFASFLGSLFASWPCPASSRRWMAQGAVRGRHLPPACPVGAAPRRPWSGGRTRPGVAPWPGTGDRGGAGPRAAASRRCGEAGAASPGANCALAQPRRPASLAARRNVF